MIMTVLGEIEAEQLGVTSSHEHIFIDMRNCVDVTGKEPPSFYESFNTEHRADVAIDPYAVLDNALLEGIDAAVKEVEYFKEHGGQTIIDCTLDEIGRNPLALKEVSKLTGVNIVVGYGHYYHKAHFPYVKETSIEALADEMRNDIWNGIGGTDVKAGIIGEIGTSAIVSDDEKKVLKAAATVGAESYVQSFAPMVATGPKNSYISMCRNTLRKIEESEIINLAAGVCYEGYNGITCSPLVLGKIPQKIKDAVKCAYEALNYASAKMQPGTPCDVVLNSYTEYLTKYGYIEYCPYGSLHSTGMLECEAPTFTVANKRIIEENMAICIDAYFKGMEWGSFRIEDCYLIGGNGAKRMTTYNDKAIPKIFGI